MKEKLTYIPNDLVSLKDYERYAKERMDLNSIAYVCSGAGDEVTYRKNEESFQEIYLKANTLEDLSGAVGNAKSDSGNPRTNGAHSVCNL